MFICDEKNCSSSYLFPGLIEITTKTERNYYLLLKKGLEKINFQDENTTPIAFSKDQNLIAAKASQESFIKLKIIDYTDGNIKKTIDLPENFTSIPSGCFFGNNSFAFLHIDEAEDLSRRYTISISTSPELSDWDSFLIKEENPNEFLSNFLSLGSVIERPVAIQCSDSKLFIITNAIFSDMLQITVYNFNIQKRTLEYITAFHPIKPESKTSLFFNSTDSTLHIFNKNKLISVKENLFPVIRQFNEPGSLYFSPFSEKGFLMFFVPDKAEKNKISARMINVGELPE